MRRGVPYKSAQCLARRCNLGAPEVLKTVLCYLDSRGLAQKRLMAQLKNQYPDVFNYWDLVEKFSSPHRNVLAHSARGQLKGTDLLETLYAVDRGFVGAVESMLKDKYQRSAFDKPQAWGAVASISDDLDVLECHFGLKQTPRGMSLKDAKVALAHLAPKP